jgi:hypothetical protein
VPHVSEQEPVVNERRRAWEKKKNGKGNTVKKDHRQKAEGEKKKTDHGNEGKSTRFAI